VALLTLAHPLTWGRSGPGLWFVPAGLGLAVIAWAGLRLGPALVLAGGLLPWAGALCAAALGWQPAPGELTFWGLDALLTPLELALAWWLYHRRAGGDRQLAGPRSAMQFLLLVPLFAAGLFSVARAVLLGGPEPDMPFAQRLAACWLSRALGELVLAPPLLILATPLFLRLGLLRSQEPSVRSQESGGPLLTPDSWSLVPANGPLPAWGDTIEAVGLTVGATALCLILTWVNGEREQLGWQLWGAPLLLIVWAGIRQGPRGSVLVASLAAAAPLLLLPVASYRPGNPAFAFLLQGHLLGQCAAALLVATVTDWVRRSEAAYRQVVRHAPVVIYSARFRDPGIAGAADRGPVAASRPLTPGLPPLDPTRAADVVLVSAASDALLGCPPEGLLGDHANWLQRVHPDDREVVQAALAQLALQDGPVACEYRLNPVRQSQEGLGIRDQGLGAGQGGPAAPPREGAGPSSLIPNPQSLIPTSWLRDTLAPLRDARGRLVGWEGVVIDVSEQRALADDLRRTTSMFNALVTNLPTGVFFVQGPHGKPLVVNARARQLLGQREDAAAGLDYLSRAYRLFRPDGSLYPVEELPVVQALRHGRTTMRDDIVVHRPDGRRLPLVSWAAPVELGNRGQGGPAAVWVLEDRSALHQAEAARLDSEARLRAVIETMAEGLVVLASGATVVSANHAACALFGLPPEKMVGQSLFGLGWSFAREDGSPLPPEEHPGQAALRTGRPVRNVVLGLSPMWNAECGMRNEDEEKKGEGPRLERWVLVSAMPLSGPSPSSFRIPHSASRMGSAAQVVLTLADISGHVRAREAIQASEARQRELIESLPVMVILGDREGRIDYCNPATRAITGYEREEIATPEAWARIVWPEDLPRFQEALASARAGQTGRVEIRYRARDGAEKVAYVLTQPRLQPGVGGGPAAPAPLPGAVVGLMALVVDVTRERALERELARSQRLELIGRLSSGVAHDFNNLLSVVLSLADLARGHLPSDHPVHADLRRITEAGEQAASLAGQLLTLSRQRRVEGRLRIELNRTVQRTLELLRATLPPAVKVRAELAEGELFVQADETQAQQVLMNLCLNARDAMPHGGALTVRTARLIEAHGPARPGWARLSVSDSGTGIPEAVKAHIFEPFYSTKDTGTGLGLAVVQQIVESYGGRVEVHSQSGLGACFDVWLPLQ
jgi:PAS domain S-box-containing protein